MAVLNLALISSALNTRTVASGSGVKIVPDSSDGFSGTEIASIYFSLHGSIIV